MPGTLEGELGTEETGAGGQDGSRWSGLSSRSAGPAPSAAPGVPRPPGGPGCGTPGCTRGCPGVPAGHCAAVRLHQPRLRDGQKTRQNSSRKSGRSTEWEVASHHCHCPIQGRVSEGGQDECDPGPVGPEPGSWMAEQPLTLPEELSAAVELPAVRFGRGSDGSHLGSKGGSVGAAGGTAGGEGLGSGTRAGDRLVTRLVRAVT